MTAEINVFSVIFRRNTVSDKADEAQMMSATISDIR